MDTIINQIINGIMLGVMYSLVAVGFTLFFGVLNLIQFSHGEIFMVGAFLGLIILNVCHLVLGIENPFNHANLGLILLQHLTQALNDRQQAT